MDLTSLRPNPHNPRIISEEDFDSLKDKIKRNPNGLAAHKIVHKDGIIIAGNQRFRALKELGLKLQEDWFLDAGDWDDEQIREWLVTSNISDGKWDWGMLSAQYDAIELEDWGLDIPDVTHDRDDEPKDPKKCPHCGEKLQLNHKHLRYNKNMSELYSDRHFEPIQDEQLFEVRRYLGRTVFILGDLIQPDFSIDDDLGVDGS